MDDDQFTKLFHYLDERFDKVEIRIGNLEDRVGSGFNHLQSAVDGIAKSMDRFETEHIAMKSQLSRHEQWIQQLADKLGVTLSAE
jgi:hypothetical protein